MEGNDRSPKSGLFTPQPDLTTLRYRTPETRGGVKGFDGKEAKDRGLVGPVVNGSPSLRIV